MAQVPKKLAQVLLADADAAIFTGLTGYVFTTSRIVICNTDLEARRFRIHAVTAGGTSSLDNACFYDTLVERGYTLEVGEGWFLEGAAMLRGMADVAGKVTVTVFGFKNRTLGGAG